MCVATFTTDWVLTCWCVWRYSRQILTKEYQSDNRQDSGQLNATVQSIQQSSQRKTKEKFLHFSNTQSSVKDLKPFHCRWKQLQTHAEMKPHTTHTEMKPHTTRTEMKPHTTHTEMKPHTTHTEMKPYTTHTEMKPHTVIKSSDRHNRLNVWSFTLLLLVTNEY